MPLVARFSRLLVARLLCLHCDIKKQSKSYGYFFVLSFFALAGPACDSAFVLPVSGPVLLPALLGVDGINPTG